MKYTVLKLSIVGLFALTGVLRLGEIILTNELAGSGGHIQTIEREISGTTEYNDQLRQRIASASSLLVLAEKATEIGLAPQVSVVAFDDGGFPVALRNGQ